MLFYILLAVLGLVFGSFLTSLTYRAESEVSISKGRSFCPKCNKTINWYDNIPLFSYLILGGKCRSCKKKISVRYPIIESITSLSFIFAGVFYLNVVLNIPWINAFPYIGVVLVLFWIVLFIGITVTDLEEQIIPDEFVFIGLAVTLIFMTLASYDKTFINLLSGAIAADVLLFLHLITKGRGMGLGDVKLAFFVGLILGPSLTFTWIFLGFILGAVVGVILLATKKAKLKAHIAFGPFLVASFFIILLAGDQISRIFLPY